MIFKLLLLTGHLEVDYCCTDRRLKIVVVLIALRRDTMVEFHVYVLVAYTWGFFSQPQQLLQDLNQWY